MSSLIGHSVTGTFIYLCTPNRRSQNRSWLAWLVFMAIFPDIDYPFLWLFNMESEIRGTHSLPFCSVMPAFTMVCLRFTASAERYEMQCVQAFGAAYSHLVLDVLVGVSPLPLLWPFTDKLFRLPFGMLPSAGQIALTNRYFYRNLVIEAGILLPVYSLILMRNRAERSEKHTMILLLHLLVFVPFLIWGIALDR